MEHHMIECVFTNTTPAPLKSFIQNQLHTSEDQNHIV
jgi:hypothetical protein